MKNKSNKHNRRSIRLKDYDYSKDGMYFITICTKNRINILSRIIPGSVKTDPYNQLNKLGYIVEKELNNIPKHFNNVGIDKYVIMPNHIHIIIKINNVGASLDSPKKIRLSNVIGLFKSGVSRKIGYSIWQRNYYEHIIRNEKEYGEIYKYIEYNPVCWEEDKLNC